MDLGREGQDTFEQSEDDGLTQGEPLGIFLDVVLGTKAILRSGGIREGGLRRFEPGDFFFIDSRINCEEWGLLSGLCKCVLSTRHELLYQLGNLLLT